MSAARITVGISTMYSALCVLFLLALLKDASGHDYLKGRIKCPLGCRCDTHISHPEEMRLKCAENVTWARLPAMPENTTYLDVLRANMRVLRCDANKNAGGKKLRKLNLLQNKISLVDSGALYNLHSLEYLVFAKNNLQNISVGTFAHIPNLLQLFFSKNKFVRIPTENTCLLKKLQNLVMDKNRLESAKFDECFTQLTDLYRVDISNNPIGEIQPEDFQGLRNSPIAILYLGGLGLKTLKKDHFKYFKGLHSLDIQNNKLTTIANDLFEYIPNLTYLVLAGNQLTEIPSEPLGQLVNLQMLDIMSNHITNVTFGSHFQKLTRLTSIKLESNLAVTLSNTTFVNLKFSTKLHELNFESCRLRVIEADAFLPLKSLTILKLDENYINASMLEQAFYGLRYAHKLSELCLEGTNLSDHTAFTFQYLANTRLTNLMVANTHIETLKSGAFRFLPKLQNLNLAGNDLKTIEENAFENLNNLIQIDLSHNRLSIPNAMVVNLRSIKTLILTGNAVGRRLISEYFHGYDKLEMLNLKSTSIRTLDSQAFRYLPNLKTLILASNEIIRISENAFAGLDKLEVLTLDHNNLAYFDIDIFSKLPTLQDLELSNNNYLTTIIKDDFMKIFTPLRNLTRLQMREIGLNDVPHDAFYNLTELSLLSISGNSLSKWPEDLFKNQQKLKTLSMKSNKLTFINEASMKHLTSLRVLDLSNNMFICDCNFTWFPEWIRTGHIYIKNLDSVTCKSPPKKSGQQLQSLFMEAECMPLIEYFIYWFVLFFNASLTTVLTMLYRFRWYFRYWRHLVRVQKAMKEEMEEERFVFDAFVSYTRADQRWVIRELLSKIEYEANIKLCLHQRNWMIGSSIPGNILKSIKKSRKTVLILSNAYARSYWCELEMAIAQQKILTSQRDTIVPILLEPIRTRYVTEQMVCLFATQTYIKWPRRNERKQRRFWRKLIKTLRPPQEPPEYDEENGDFLTNIR